MDSRTKLKRTLSFCRDCARPRYESEFSDEVVRAWRAQGHLDERPPEEFFELDRRESLNVAWRRLGAEKSPLDNDAALASLRQAYAPTLEARLPKDYGRKVGEWRQRDFALYAAPWNEGFLQIIGISDSASLSRALIALREEPALAEAAMDLYATYLETLLDEILPQVDLDYALFYEPIASNSGPVISPEDYRHFVQPALRRVVACLDNHGVEYRFIWSAGAVTSLIPLWLEAGINGLYLNQAGSAGIRYSALRREYGQKLLLFGGIDWRAVMHGPAAIDKFIETHVHPLLDQGGYIPYLDDTIRPYMPFNHFHYYRRRLREMIDHQVCEQPR